LPKKQKDLPSLAKGTKRSTFAHTSHSLRLLERIGASVQRNEAVLLVGETGTGKTSVVQYLAEQAGNRLVVINMSQQSESSDLLGGFKPVDVRLLCAPLLDEFELLFGKTFSKKSNEKFLDSVRNAYISKSWTRLLTLMNSAVSMAEKKFAKQESQAKPSEDPEERTKGKKREARSQGSEPEKKAKTLEPELKQQWKKLSADLSKFQAQRQQVENNFLFSFTEGTLVKAVKRGQWVLLDEINLASTETLECLSGLLEGPSGTLLLTEKGDSEPCPRHPDFRVFACMNPATDVGKRDLPPGLRNRLTEIFVDELENPEDLATLVRAYLQNVPNAKAVHSNIVSFYLKAKKVSPPLLSSASFFCVCFSGFIID